MSETENEGKGFKVEDKRKFTTDGELRTETPENEKAPPEAPETSGSAGEPEDPGKEAATRGAESPRVSPETASKSGPEVGPPPDLGLLDLVNMLAGNALVALGDLPEPVSGKRVENLESVQVMIAFLSVLRDKTKGNLEEREEKILDDLLYDLRMRFMAKANLIKL
jgi:hypothetical protein